MNKKTLQIIGPFITNYSYARVNRGLAKALSEIQDEFEIKLYQDKEKIDKWPDESDLQKYPYIKELWSQSRLETDSVIYFDHPKGGYVKHGLKDLPGKLKLMVIGWEETVYPKMWVDEINENIHGLIVISDFVKEVMKKNGVKVPIRTVHCGLDDSVRLAKKEVYLLQTKKKFKFFHNSTARKRKGVDVLLKAYFAEFTKNDDICLVIKSFPGPDNMVNEILNELKNDNSPEVEHIYSPDLTDQEIVNLVNTCDVGVYPSRAEGFGLPIAESMYHGKVTIATNYSSYLDFCDSQNSFLVDYKLVPAIDSEMVNIGAKWAEPDQKDLQQKMKYVFENYEKTSKFEEMSRLAHESTKELTWENAAKKTLEFVKELEGVNELKNKNAAVMSLLNSKDGIAIYTKDLYQSVESSFQKFYYIANSDISDRTDKDEENVIRIWQTGDEDFQKIYDFVKENNIEIFHIQYHSGIYYTPQALDKLIYNLKYLGVKVFLTLHSVRGKNFDFAFECKNLGLVNRIFIHNKEDYEHVKSKQDNAILFNLPKLVFKKRDKRYLRSKLGIGEDKIIIATHGLLNQQKSKVENVIRAINILKNDYPHILYFAMHPVLSSNLSSGADFEQCTKLIKEFNLEENIIFIPEFLDLKEIEILLQASDLIIFPYKEVGESASAAIDKALASLNPVIVTDIKMFGEFDEEVYKIQDYEVDTIVNAVMEVIKDEALRDSLINSAKKYIQKNSYDKKAVETLRHYL
jgi:glycosyltransferase involved in cell wall biosynthesis